MKILYDYQAFSWQKWGGVSNSFIQLIKNLPSDVTYQIAIKETDNVHLLKSNITDVVPCQLSGEDFITKRFFPGKYRLYKWFTKMFPNKTTNGRNFNYAKELLTKQNFDIFHPTFFDNYFLKYIGDKPFVLTIHDMIPELIYENNRDPQIAAKRFLASKAAHIIAVSKNTKKDIINVLHIPEDKISVVYHGTPNIPEFPQNRIFNFKYLLYVGGRNLPYKNFKPMLKSIAPLLADSKDLKLVCTGSAFNEGERELINELHLGNKVVHYFFNNDFELMNLYHNAECFIFPSLYEGFGIPILEAYQAGCPVLLNKKSCFPEIAGDAAIFFTLDKENNNLCSVLDTFLHYSNDELKKLLKCQNDRKKLFTWNNSAKSLVKSYKKVLAR